MNNTTWGASIVLIWTDIYIYIYAYICIYIEAALKSYKEGRSLICPFVHTGRQTDRQTDPYSPHEPSKLSATFRSVATAMKRARRGRDEPTDSLIVGRGWKRNPEAETATAAATPSASAEMGTFRCSFEAMEPSPLCRRRCLGCVD